MKYFTISHSDSCNKYYVCVCVCGSSKRSMRIHLVSWETLCYMATPPAELLPLEGSKSAGWSNFGFPAQGGRIILEKKNRKKVYCKLCSTSIKYSGNTTNLHFHLKEHHRNTYSALPALDKRNRPLPTQPTLTETLSSVKKIPTSSPKWN